MIIREADPFSSVDCRRLSELLKFLGQNTTESEIYNRLSRMQIEGSKVFVAETHGLIIGAITISWRTTLGRGVRARLETLVVDRSYRRQGVARDLVSNAERYLKVLSGLNVVELTSQSHRNEAHEFWKAQGYIQTSNRFEKTLT